jgi:preprotein translocase subunit SecY
MEEKAMLRSGRVTCPHCESVLVPDTIEIKRGRVECPVCGKDVVLEKTGSASQPPVNPEPLSRAEKLKALLAAAGPFRNKILFTLAGIAIYRIGFFMIIPGINHRLLHLEYPWNLIGNSTTLFGQRIYPYLAASVLVMVWSAFIPPLRRLREGTLTSRLRFNQIILLVTIFLSFMEAWQSYGVLAHRSIAGEPLLDDSIITQISYLGISVAGTLFLVWLSQRITRDGLGNGVAILLLTDFIWNITLYGNLRHGNNGELSAAGWMWIAGAALILFVMSIVVVVASRRFVLVPVDKQGPGASNPPAIRIRAMASGLAPFIVTPWILSLVQNLFSIKYSHLWYTISYILLIILLSLLYAALTYDPADLRQRLGRFGYRVSTPGFDALLERSLLNVTIVGIIYAAVLVVGIDVLYTATGIYSPLISKEVLSIAAIGVMIASVIGDALNKWSTEDSHPATNDGGWRSVYSSDILLEGELVKDILSRSSIDSVVSSNRAICATGTLGAWEICKPRYPAFMIYPGLAGGSVDVYVTEDKADQAVEILRKALPDEPENDIVDEDKEK